MTSEVATVETSVSTIHLSDIAGTKGQMNELRERIAKLEEEAGITSLKEELHALEDVYKRQVSTAVESGLFAEDHYQLINKGRVMTTIHPKELFERYPDIFWRTVKVTKGKTEDLLLWMYEDMGQSKSAAKKSVAAVIEEISSKEQSGENYDLVDLLNGE